MFERCTIALTALSVVLLCACGSENKVSPPSQADAREFVRRSGPAYFIEPRSGILELSATQRGSLSLPLARHRPGRSEIWLDGLALGRKAPAWKLRRAALDLELHGGMVAGLHKLALLTPQYANYPLSPPVLVSIQPAPPAELLLEEEPSSAIAEVQRIFYPGSGTLSGSPLAWLLRNNDPQAQRIQSIDASPILNLPADSPKLASASKIALRLDHDPPELLATFPSDPNELWLWRFDQEPPSLIKLSIPHKSSELQQIDRISVAPRGFLVSRWEGQGRWWHEQRPGQQSLWRLDTEAQRPELTQLSPAQLQQPDQPTDLSIDAFLKVRDENGPSTQLRLRADNWQAQSGPLPGNTQAGLFWRSDLRVPLGQRCATLSPLGDEIWAGLDRWGQMHAGVRPAFAGSDRRFELPDTRDPEVALLALPLDCALVEGRFLAVKASPRAPFSRFLHFDGARMQLVSSELACEDAALVPSKDQNKLWCLRKGNLLPITLGWRESKKAKAPGERKTPARSR